MIGDRRSDIGDRIGAHSRTHAATTSALHISVWMWTAEAADLGGGGGAAQWRRAADVRSGVC